MSRYITQFDACVAKKLESTTNCAVTWDTNVIGSNILPI